ncbi:hypothetical protein E4U57_000720 [Claviceps arundinis]|uniref:Uncharacterized protein n=1 Tax=Claviceps arundinis TaxID=1623583 RepID=A0A9P7STW2_9HYPO|nr:hypothetical protein E4U57_000720 [Claviceps arundinis]KAG5977319.1 hypothetical protein E4U56_008144 [Claviceps arundinis]
MEIRSLSHGTKGLSTQPICANGAERKRREGIATPPSRIRGLHLLDQNQSSRTMSTAV